MRLRYVRNLRSVALLRIGTFVALDRTIYMFQGFPANEPYRHALPASL